MLSVVWFLLGIATLVLHLVTGEDQSVSNCAMLLCFCLAYLVEIRNLLSRKS